ncbi:MAG TPA: TIR domain-containing protein [bacterium]|nr:TIR domain-containing protein [bacterium]
MERNYLLEALLNKSKVKHKVFISYHKDDIEEVKEFIKEFSEDEEIFITRALDMEKEIIDSKDTDYVMQRIKELYLKDSTVTIVLIGKCTWSRRFVDWEIQSSLRQGKTLTPNGLLGVKLKSYNQNGYPDRLNKNLKQNDEQDDCYARAINYPDNKETLQKYIDDAFNARSSRAHLIVNTRERFEYNKSCS